MFGGGGVSWWWWWCLMVFGVVVVVCVSNGLNNVNSYFFNFIYFV